MKRLGIVTSLTLFTIVLLGGCRPQQDKVLKFGGGPKGGTYQGYAETLSRLLEEGGSGLRFKVKPSGGSVANLKDIEKGEVDLALAYASDLAVGLRGGLPGQTGGFKQVRVAANLYSAPAHLVVLADAPWRGLDELSGARVAIGNIGSGTAEAAGRFFRRAGVWDQIIPIHIGFSLALKELAAGSIDALWLVVGAPNPALSRFAKQHPVRLLPLLRTAGEVGLFGSFPGYAATRFPTGTYPGQWEEISSFADTALLVVSGNMPTEEVVALLERLFAPERLAELAERHPVGHELSHGRARPLHNLPIHPGATLFWRQVPVGAGTQ